MPDGFEGPKCDIDLPNACPFNRVLRLFICGSVQIHMYCTSLHELKRANQVQPAAKFEHHMCPVQHCSRVFPKLHKILRD